MIKLVIEIKEEETLNLKNVKAVGTNISVKEIGLMATNTEKKVSKMFKDRMNFEDKIEIENFSNVEKNDLKKELEKLLKRL